MEDHAFELRLIEIASKVMPSVVFKPAEDACWFDGSKCPYGKPEGKFQYRPGGSCHGGSGGCFKLVQNGNLMSFLDKHDKHIDAAVQEKISKITSRESVTLSGEIRVIAKDAEEGTWTEEQKEILILVADLIEENPSQNTKIIRMEDIMAY